MYGGLRQIGRTGLLRIPAAVNQAITAIRPQPDRLCSEFLLFYLNYRVAYWSSVASSSRKDPNITGADVRAFKLPLPTVDEQRQIAAALADADALIESLEQLLTKKRQIKQGATQELLTGKRRLPGFSHPWRDVRLCQLGNFLKGSGIRRDEALSGDLPSVRYGEIYTTHSDYIRTFQSWIDPATASTATKLQRGDLLFAGSGETKEEIGKCVAFLDDFVAYAGGDIVILRPSCGVDSMFMGYALNTPSVARQKASKGQGDAVVHISPAALGQLTIGLPELAEQSAIAQVLSDMDADIAALESRLIKARDLKQGMAQALLTGRIRLVPPEA
jgi:type I restriction enzyme, S subunit